jgi:hypothetical protein
MVFGVMQWKHKVFALKKQEVVPLQESVDERAGTRGTQNKTEDV